MTWQFYKRRGRRLADEGFAAMVMALAIGAQAGSPLALNKACGLVTTAELEGLLASKISLKASSMGDVDSCMGETPGATVTVRYFKKASDQSAERGTITSGTAGKGGRAIKGAASPRAVSCSTAMPRVSQPEIGFGLTACSVIEKATTLAVIEIRAKSQKDMISTAKVRPLAERMALRF